MAQLPPVVVDSSIWIHFFGKPESALSAHLVMLMDEDKALLTNPVKIELLTGAAKSEASRLQRLLEALPCLTPLEAHWQTAEDWALRGALKGYHFAMGDLVIGACAALEDAPLWSLDRDFAAMERMGFLKRYSP